MTKRSYSEEKSFRLRPQTRRRSCRDEIAIWSSGLRRLMGFATQSPRSVKASSGAGSKRTMRITSRATRARNQRVAVRVTYAPNKTPGHWKAHGRYIARDSASQRTRELPPGFGPDGPVHDIGATLESWQIARDPRLFKLIISPEFGERMDLTAHTRALMEGMSRDLGLTLDWVAVVHHNTDHPHAHIALRGMASNGDEVRLPREYIQKGIRLRAEDFATNQLGIRTQDDILEAQRREVSQQRFTPLDRIIGRQQIDRLAGSNFSVVAHPTNPALSPYARQNKQQVANRLRNLASMGLATQVSPTEWTVRGNFADVLRTMQRISDRQKTLAQHQSLASDPRLPFQVENWRMLGNLEGRILAHGEEESGKRYMLLEGTDYRIHYLIHTPEIEAARRTGKLAPNSFLSIQRIKEDGNNTHKLEHLGDADSILSNPRFLEPRAVMLLPKRAQSLPSEGDDLADSQIGGWLRQYKTAVKKTAAMMNGEIRHQVMEAKAREIDREFSSPPKHRPNRLGR